MKHTKRLRSRIHFAILTVGVSLFFGGIFGDRAVAAPSKVVKLVLNWKAEPEFGGFFEAKLMGAFEKRGLNVEILEGGAGTPVAQMVASGQAEFGIAGADDVILASERGMDIQALFAVYQQNPQGVMAHAARGFKTIGDVMRAPGRLAMQKGAAFTLFLQKKYPDAKVTIVPYTGGISNFLADPEFSQQCYVTAEPIAARDAKANTTALLISDEGYNPYGALLVTRAKTIGANEQLVRDFLSAVREGWGSYLKNPTRANTHMQKLNPSMSVATFQEGSRIQAPLIETAETRKAGVGSMTLERWKTLISQLKDLKLIRKEPDAAKLFRNDL